jgi:ClpP class serine protease
MAMDIVEAFSQNIWLVFFFFLVLLPRLQQSAILGARRNALQSLVNKRKTNVITLIHRQETISLLGLPLQRYIDIEDSEEVIRLIRMTPENQPIDLIIHTPGGIALAATQIAFALKAHKGKTSVLVPHYAMSGGTLIALAADEILMDKNAVLGPVDPQLGTAKGTFSASSIIKASGRKEAKDTDDETLYMAEEAQKAVVQMKELVKKLIEDKYPPAKVDEIVQELVSGKYTHDYPISAERVCSLLGQCTYPELPVEVYKLMHFYRMGRQQRPGIEYVPLNPRIED